jgi:hypothetical protein
MTGFSWNPAPGPPEGAGAAGAGAIRAGPKPGDAPAHSRSPGSVLRRPGRSRGRPTRRTEPARRASPEESRNSAPGGDRRKSPGCPGPRVRVRTQRVSARRSPRKGPRDRLLRQRPRGRPVPPSRLRRHPPGRAGRRPPIRSDPPVVARGPPIRRIRDIGPPSGLPRLALFRRRRRPRRPSAAEPAWDDPPRLALFRRRGRRGRTTTSTASSRLWRPGPSPPRRERGPPPRAP